jgi:hypothetical protein
MEPSSRIWFPAWLQGSIFGLIIWILSGLAAYGLEASEASFPRWMKQLDLVDTVGSVFMVIAAPIAVGGWLMIWGDGPQPPSWLTSLSFNVGFGICFYALLGGVVGLWFSKQWPGRLTTVRLLIVVSIAIFVVGITPLLWEQWN